MIESNRISKYIDMLQVFRGLAAFFVVLHHTIPAIHYYHNLEYSWLNFIQSLGKFGVDFFFVLSGFIISYTTFIKRRKKLKVSEYFKNRLVRIYVPYLPIGVLLLFLYTFLPQFSNSSREISVLTSLTLIPDGNPALSVAWTLSFEIIFYVLFSLYFISKNVWRVFSVIWFLVIIIANYVLFYNSENIFIEHLLSLYNMEFLIGTLLTYLILEVKRFKKSLILLFLIIFVILFCYLIYSNQQIFIFSKNIAFTLFAFFLLYYTICYKNISIKKNNILMLYGNASYSIYLTHSIIHSSIVRFFPKFNIQQKAFIMLAIIIIVTGIIGYIYYYVFEFKGINEIKKILK